MPNRRKYPLRLYIDGTPIQVRLIEGDLFQSKKTYYRAHYEASGQLIGQTVHQDVYHPQRNQE